MSVVNQGEWEDAGIDVYSAPTLPVDVLILDFVADSFDRYIDRIRQPSYESMHLRTCPDREWRLARVEGAHSCGDGTCDYDPSLSAEVGCPHGVGSLRWSVERETMAELLDALHEFSETRRRSLDAFIGRSGKENR